jgi:branched-chain amino acid transport system substrate-binding protein
MRPFLQKSFGIGVCACLLILALWGRPVQAVDPIRLGLVFSITGYGGFIGTPQKDATVAIVDDVNRRGGIHGRPVELFIEDDKSNPTNAAIATTKLIKDKKVSMMIGPSITDSGMAMIPICEQEKTPFIVTGPVVSPFRKWSFLVGPGDTRGAVQLFDTAIKKFNPKKIAFLHDSSNYGMTAAKILKTEIAKYPGVSFVIEEQFEPTDTTMVPQLTKVKATNPDMILIYTSSQPAAVIAKNYKQLGITTQVAGSGGIAVPEFIKNVGKIAEESRWAIWELKAVTAEKLPMDDPYRRDIYEPFKALLKEKYGPSKEVSVFHAVAYDGIQIAIETLKLANSDDRVVIRDALEKVRFTKGFISDFQCTPQDHQGGKIGNLIFNRIQNGELWPYDAR